ncbi:MAG: hypothetical protein GEU81_09045 [Nitriliruptorales bacterium]|nr:hypothetical protein [Nitriliruptorales bacterium]
MTRTTRRQVEAAERGLHRRRFLEAVGLAGAGVAALYAWHDRPLAGAQAPGDVDITEFALILSTLEVTYWEQGLRRELLTGRDREVAQAIRDHAVQHRRVMVETLTDLGADPLEEADFHVPEEAFADRDAFFTMGSRLEELWVEGYHGLLTAIASPELTMLTAALAGSKSRHAAMVALLLEGEALVGPVERAGDPARLLEEISMFRGDQDA